MIDVDQVVALYKQGASMLTLAERFDVSRHTIRRILVSNEVPTRPSGRPRLPVSSEDIAELYEAGVTFYEISTRLGIHVDAARTRYEEIRSQRGLSRRGPWHQVLLSALAEQPSVAVLPTAAAYLGREPTRNEAHAVRRAARDLARAGEARSDHQVRPWRGGSALMLVLESVNLSGSRLQEPEEHREAEEGQQPDQKQRGGGRLPGGGGAGAFDILVEKGVPDVSGSRLEGLSDGRALSP